MSQNSESSVEDILESIKKVIARDTGDEAFLMRQKKTGANAPDPVEQSEAEEILDLSEMEYVSDEDLVLTEMLEDDADMAEANEHDEDAVPLTTAAAEGAMRDNLAALAMMAEPSAKPQIVRSGETSLEGLTRELLRPMLAEWLDKNLPGMVEKMVQAEIARIAGKRR